MRAVLGDGEEAHYFGKQAAWRAVVISTTRRPGGCSARCCAALEQTLALVDRRRDFFDAPTNQ